MIGITVDGVGKSFGETRALAAVSLEAGMGEVHAIVGENGSGKSTLAKIISGVLAPDAGRVEVLGAVPRSPRQMQRLGVAPIFQEMMLADQLSIAENVFAGHDGLFRRRLSARTRRAAAGALMERLSGQGIDPATPVAGLPLHVKQWIVLARAIRSDPRVLILDESSAALDQAGTERLHGEIRRLREAGACILIVTHRIAELVRIADKATVLRDGRTVGTLARHEITERNLLALMSGGGVQASSRAGVAGMPSVPVLRCEGVRLGAGAQPFDFTLREGEIVGLTGLDGAGQTEFVRTLAGIDRPAAGRVEALVGGGGPAPVGSVEAAAGLGIAYVSGDRRREGIFPALSVFENFAMALYGRHRTWGGLIDDAALRSEFDRQVARLSVKLGRPTDRITSLSGGNQQKVLIARALAANPGIIVLNDPAHWVDIGTKQDLYHLLSGFAERGGAVVYLTSEIEELFGFAHRVDVFVTGTLHRSLPSREVGEEAVLHAMFGHVARRGGAATAEVA